MKAAKQRYEKRQQRYDEFLQRQKKTERKISNLRLIVFVIGTCTAILTYIFRNYIFLAAIIVLFLGVFIYLVIHQDKLINRIKYTTLLLDINKTSLKRVNGEWNRFVDAGEDFLEDSHNYTGDLDIFGKGSLFQWISAANTFTGREELRDLLTDVEGNRDDICERQEAVDELAMLLNWRQRFLAEGMTTSKKIGNPEEESLGDCSAQNMPNHYYSSCYCRLFYEYHTSIPSYYCIVTPVYTGFLQCQRQI